MMIPMHHIDEYIQKNFPKNQYEYAYEVANELWSMFLALEKKEPVRPSLKGRGEDFLEIIKDTDKIFKAFNKFFDIYMDKGKRDKFFDLLSRNFGFTNEDLIYMLHSYMVFMFLAVTEMFKNTLVFILKDISPTKTLGQLLGKRGILIKETDEAKKIGEKLNIKLRNALAHFMFRKEGKKIYYYQFEKKKEKEDWLLVKREIDLGELYVMSLKHNTLNKLLVEMIPEWYGL